MSYHASAKLIYFPTRNIDRYLAIWQDVHPEKWFDGRQSGPMLESNLLPFFSPKGQDKNGFWTSKSARRTEAFGHTYPDVKGNPQATKENFRRLYSWSIRPQPEPQGWKPTPPKEMEPLDLSGAQVFKDHPEYVAPTPPIHLAGQAKANLVSSMMTVPQPLEAIHLQKKSVTSAKFREWFVDDTVERSVELLSRCTVVSLLTISVKACLERRLLH